jgi:hypothetical protein
LSIVSYQLSVPPFTLKFRFAKLKREIKKVFLKKTFAWNRSKATLNQLPVTRYHYQVMSYIEKAEAVSPLSKLKRIKGISKPLALRECCE